MRFGCMRWDTSTGRLISPLNWGSKQKTFSSEDIGRRKCCMILLTIFVCVKIDKGLSRKVLVIVKSKYRLSMLYNLVDLNDMVLLHVLGNWWWDLSTLETFNWFPRSKLDFSFLLSYFWIFECLESFVGYLLHVSATNKFENPNWLSRDAFFLE